MTEGSWRWSRREERWNYTGREEAIRGERKSEWHGGERDRWNDKGMRGNDLEAELLSQNAAVQGFDEDVLLHAQVQSLHRAAGTEQRLMGARLLQLGEASSPGERDAKSHNHTRSHAHTITQSASHAHTHAPFSNSQ